MSGRIVVGIDGSSESRMALRWAVEEAVLREAELDVVYAWHHPEAAFIPAFDFPTEDHLQADAQELADRIVADEGMSRRGAWRVNTIVASGSPAATLLDAAKGADLLVVGSRGRGGFRGMLLGSVSQHCVGHAPCPVAVIHSGRD